MNWADQMRALVIFPDNFRTNTVWYNLIWSNETVDPGLLSVSLSLDPYVFPFISRCHILSVTNIHDTKRSTSSFRSNNFTGRTPIFSSLNMDSGWRWDNLSFQYLNSCCKCYSTSGNMIFSIHSCVRFLDLLIKYSD